MFGFGKKNKKLSKKASYYDAFNSAHDSENVEIKSNELVIAELSDDIEHSSFLNRLRIAIERNRELTGETERRNQEKEHIEREKKLNEYGTLKNFIKEQLATYVKDTGIIKMQIDSKFADILPIVLKNEQFLPYYKKVLKRNENLVRLGTDTPFILYIGLKEDKE